MPHDFKTILFSQPVNHTNVHYVRNLKLSLRSAQNIKLKREPVYFCSKLGCLYQLSHQSPKHPASYCVCVCDRVIERDRESAFSLQCLNGTVIISFQQIARQPVGFPASCPASCCWKADQNSVSESDSLDLWTVTAVTYKMYVCVCVVFFTSYLSFVRL